MGLEKRSQERSGNLSGGLQRRVELAKALIHGPELLILDEPSSGLDPGARKDFWNTLKELRSSHGTTVVLTTHLMEEAERCDRLAILHQGQVVALGDPESLKSELGGDVLSIVAREPQVLKEQIRSKFACSPSLVDGTIRIEGVESHRMLSELVQEFGEWIQSTTLNKPTLEDVFIHRTGHKFFWSSRGESDS
jgi:ABC-2 type transport system ATP-binding protein